MGVRDWCDQLPGGSKVCGAICLLILINVFGILMGYGLGIGNQAVFIGLVVVMLVLLIGYVVFFCFWQRRSTDKKRKQTTAEARAYDSLDTSAPALESMPALALKPRDAHAAYTPYSEA